MKIRIKANREDDRAWYGVQSVNGHIYFVFLVMELYKKQIEKAFNAGWAFRMEDNETGIQVLVATNGNQRIAITQNWILRGDFDKQDFLQTLKDVKNKIESLYSAFITTVSF